MHRACGVTGSERAWNWWNQRLYGLRALTCYMVFPSKATLVTRVTNPNTPWKLFGLQSDSNIHNSLCGCKNGQKKVDSGYYERIKTCGSYQGLVGVYDSIFSYWTRVGIQIRTAALGGNKSISAIYKSLKSIGSYHGLVDTMVKRSYIKWNLSTRSSSGNNGSGRTPKTLFYGTFFHGVEECLSLGVDDRFYSPNIYTANLLGLTFSKDFSTSGYCRFHYIRIF